MKKIEVTLDALDRIDGLRNGDDFSQAKTSIADAFSSLANMLHAGRESEEISDCADDLLSVMAVLGEYNGLVNALSDTSDRKSGFYMYETNRKGGESC